jgi:hypothetical protein
MKLGNGEVKGIVESATTKSDSLLRRESPGGQEDHRKVHSERQGRLAAKKARDLTRRKSALENNAPRENWPTVPRAILQRASSSSLRVTPPAFPQRRVRDRHFRQYFP